MAANQVRRLVSTSTLSVLFIVYIGSLFAPWVCDLRPSVSTCYAGVWCLLWMLPWLSQSLADGGEFIGQSLLILVFVWPPAWWFMLAFSRGVGAFPISKLPRLISAVVAIAILGAAFSLPQLFSGNLGVRPALFVALSTPLISLCVLFWEGSERQHVRGSEQQTGR